MWTAILMLAFANVVCGDIEYTETKDVTLQIVGMFSSDENAREQRAVFEKNVNEYKLNTEQVTYKLEARMLQTQHSNSFSIWQTLCKEAVEKEMTPVVVFGPQDPIADGAVRDECTSLHIPHLQAAWQPPSSEREDVPSDELSEQKEEGGGEEEENEEENGERRRKQIGQYEEEEEEQQEENAEIEYKDITINYYPHADDLSTAYAKLLKFYNWQSFSVLYEDDFGLMRVQKILSLYTTNYPVAVHRLEARGDNRRAFKEMAKRQESRVLLDCDVKNVQHYLEQAEPLNMVNHYQHYILTSIDVSSINSHLERFRPNISWLSITNFDELTNPQHSLAPTAWRWTSDQSAAAAPPLTSFKVEPFLMADMSDHILAAANLLGETLKDSTPAVPCKADQEPWSLGAAMQDSLLKTQTKGATGNVAFDETGRRVNYTLYVNEIYVHKRDTIGWWYHADGGDIVPEVDENLKATTQHSSKHFRVISRIAKPYFYKVDNYTGSADNPEAYEGFAVDLIAAIFELLNGMNYNYTYSYAGDLIHAGKSPGTYVESQKKWNGLIGDLLDKNADLAIADLTITEERKKVVDFSVPFMTLGISILFKKEHEVDPATFSFLHPYSFEVWINTATAYLVVSIVLYVCSRLSPADWENPQPCDKDPEELENIWFFKNCTWLTMGSIMTQGCDILPKAIGSRWVCGMWWFFALIVCQTYIAQLAASLTSAAESEPINDVEDLAKQSSVLYGLMYGGSTYAFFKNSKDKMYQRMFEKMESNPGVYTTDNDEGEQLVLKGKGSYAFFMESSTIEYKLKRNCELAQIGSNLDSKDYGIAMPANSPFRTIINMAILSLKENTKLEAIRKVWWEEKYDAVQCEEYASHQQVDSVNLKPLSRYRFDVKITSSEREDLLSSVFGLRNFNIVTMSTERFKVYRIDLQRAGGHHRPWARATSEESVAEEDADADNVEGDLEMKNLIGAFYVLVVGLVLCMFITAAEFMNEVRNIVVREQSSVPQKEKRNPYRIMCFVVRPSVCSSVGQEPLSQERAEVTHKEAFIKELKASLDFSQLQKPVLRNPSRAPSVAPHSRERSASYAASLSAFLELEKMAG
ncbi:Glutamate receptor ionotropic, kainate 3 [Eumeta japonica]|uniref:Glutamate receptor ionotropic, kainate 3 n=1 Tax=Eumeta variegata TaxID=151549 RepID=A0A4C1YX50_EUMVA|nr:Glutamate receptor ionotropic, kainate 3 [Eumeta japonica]